MGRGPALSYRIGNLNLTLPCPDLYAILEIRCDKQCCLFINIFGTGLALSFFTIMDAFIFLEHLGDIKPNPRNRSARRDRQ